MSKAIVSSIQVGGIYNVDSLEKACRQYIEMVEIASDGGYRAKIQFIIKLPNNEVKMITIRDEDTETVAYGDFEGLPSFLEYSKEVLGYKEK